MAKRKFKDLAAPVMHDPTRRARVEEYARGIAEAVRLAEFRERRQLTQTGLADG